MEPEDIVALLAQRMAKLPAVQRKVLAMYYYEEMQLRDIATCFGLTESSKCAKFISRRWPLSEAYFTA